MSVINTDVLNNQEISRKAEQAIYEISDCLRPIRTNNNYRVALAAYLLHKISLYNNPLAFNYQELLRIDFGLGDDSAIAIAEAFVESEWNLLSALLVKYTSETFAVATYKCDINHGLRSDGMETTPDSIIRLSQKILAIKPGEKVADICCGFGTFLSESSLVEPSAEYSGYEINPNSKLIATIRTRLVNEEINITLQDVFEIPNKEPRLLFDKIFSNYPLRMPVRNLGSGLRYFGKIIEKYPGLSRATSSDWMFNLLLCELLDEQGKAVGIMTNGSTWNSIDMPMRKYLIEKGFIESVISLPERMFNTTFIATSLIVLSRGNSSVRIVDASKICQQGRRYNEFSDTDIDTIVSALANDSDISRAIEIDELRANEYTLSLNRYLKDEISFANATPFEEVIKSITRGAPCTARQLDEMVSDNVTNMQYLMLANIRDGLIDDKLPYLSQIDPKFEKYCLKNDDLILSKNGYPYKVAVANISKGQKILANGNLYIIELDLDKADPYYLKAFFESEQGIAVLKSITVGATIPNIGIDKLKKVKIPVPPIEVQKRIAEKYRTTLDEISIYKIKMEKAMSRLHHIFDEESEG